MKDIAQANFANNKIEKCIADRRFESLNKNGSLLVVTEENKNEYEKEMIAGIVEFHLILVFDDTGVLNRHELIRVQP